MIRFLFRHHWLWVLGLLLLSSGSAFSEIRYQNLWWLPSNYTKIGEDIDYLYYIIFWLTLVVFIVTEILLFYWIIKFREKPGRKALYSHGNNTAEIIWTTIPAIIFFGLAFYSNHKWYTYFPSDGQYGTAYNKLMSHLPSFLANTMKFEGKIPEERILIEITAEQYGFHIRYPGADGILGQHNDHLMSMSNKLGLVKEDPAGADDIILYNEMVIPVGHPVQLQLRSRDVIHSFYVPEFRLYQDAVPGKTITYLWFETTGVAQVSLACSQLCGSGHYNMQGKIAVVPQEDYDKWISGKIVEKQKSLAQISISEKSSLIAKKN